MSRRGAAKRAHSPGRVSLVRSASGHGGFHREWIRLSTVTEPFLAWGGLFLAAALACFFPGQARATPDSSPPAVPRAVVLHLDCEVGDDEASGLSWEEPLRSLDEVQRRIDGGTFVAGLRLAAGWYAGTLATGRPLRVQGGFPPAGLPREGVAGVHGDPALHRTVIDGLGRGPVISVEEADLWLDGVVLAGGWSLEGGAVAVSGGSLSARRVEILDSGPALVGCRDCESVELRGALLARGTVAALELRGAAATQVRLRDFRVLENRHLLVAESPAVLDAADGELGELEGEPLRLPDGSEVSLERVERLSAEAKPAKPSATPTRGAARRDGAR